MPFFMLGCNCETGQFLATPSWTGIVTETAFSLETVAHLHVMVASSLGPTLA